MNMLSHWRTCDAMNRTITTAEIMIFLAPSLILAAVAIVAAIALDYWAGKR